MVQMLALEGEAMKKKTTKNKLTAFLYLLLMDEVSAEKLESTIEELGSRYLQRGTFEMENEYLADYAKDMAERLSGDA